MLNEWNYTMNMLNGRLSTSKNGIDNQWDRTKDYTEYTTENKRDRKYKSEVNFDRDYIKLICIYLIGISWWEAG